MLRQDLLISLVHFRQLKSESKLFTVVDKNLKDIMRRVSDNPNALKAATSAGKSINIIY